MDTFHLPLDDPAFIADPYPLLEQLRDHSPIFYDPALPKIWFTRYDDISSLLRDRRLGRSLPEGRTGQELGLPPPDPAQAPFDHFQDNRLMDKEPPEHTRLRGLVSKAFTPGRVQNLRQKVEQIVNHLLDAVEPQGGMDVVRDLGEPLPVIVIAELLGVPGPDRHRLRPWSNDIVKLYELQYTPEQVQRASRAVVEFSDYLRGLARERRLTPQDDLISALLRVEEQGQLLTEDELIANCIFLLNAGHEATVNAISLGLLALFRNPVPFKLLTGAARTDPSTDSPLFKSAIEELLRYDTPLPLFERWVLEDFEHKGHVLRRGMQVAFLYISGNRDPQRFGRPNELDLLRRDNQHLTFAQGIHYCLGAPLARLELQVAFHELLRRFPDLRPSTGHVEFNPGFVIRGLKELPVRLVATGAEDK